jgi:hypothetical protein
VTLTGDAPTEVYTAALLSLRYINAEDEPTVFVNINNTMIPVIRMIVMTIIDSGLHGLPEAAAIAKVALDIEMVNDKAPLLLLNVSPLSCHAEAESVMLSKRSVLFDILEWSWLDQGNVQELTVVRAELHGNGCFHGFSEARLFIQFSSDTNTPSVTDLHSMLSFTPGLLHQSNHVAYWENADLLIIDFPNGLQIRNSSLIFVSFSELDAIDHEQVLCNHKICSDGEVPRAVVGTYRVHVPTLNQTDHTCFNF